jgi:hypothetical protein
MEIRTDGLVVEHFQETVQNCHGISLACGVLEKSGNSRDKNLVAAGTFID